MSGQPGVKVRSMFCELPSLSFKFEVVRDEGPVECGHPVGNVMVFLDPGLIVSVVGCELNGGVVVNVVVGMPIA